jgi:hypothetical protein
MTIYSKGRSLLKLKKGTVITPGCWILCGDKYEQVKKWSVIVEEEGKFKLVEK